MRHFYKEIYLSVCQTAYTDKFLVDRRGLNSKVDLLKTNFFRIAGTSEAETSVSGKVEYLLAIGEDQKVSFLE